MKPKGINNSSMREGQYQVFDWLESISDDFYADYITENLKLNIYKIKRDFFEQFNQYVIIRRGMSYIIQDSFNNKELLFFPFTPITKDKIYRRVSHTCSMLNDGNLIYMLDNLNNNIVNDTFDDVEMPFHRDKKLHGTVVINVVDMEDNYVSEASISIDGKIEKVTDENGQCTIHHLHYGDHAIFIKKDGYSPLIVHIDVDNEEQSYELILLDMSDENE